MNDINEQEVINHGSNQYSLIKILSLWALVAAPMGLMRFILMPWLIEHVNYNPGLMYWCLMILGMVWQFVLSVILLKKELGDITWHKLKKRLWINHPIDQKTMKINKKVYFMTIPVILYASFWEQFGFFAFIEEWINNMFPVIAPPSYAVITNLVSPNLVGAWYVMGIAIVSCIFNYLLGEELFFRGILLPKMNGVFGRWDWVFNSILFTTYHIHKISEIPLFLIGSIFIAYLSKKYKSIWPAIIIHGVEGIPLLVIVYLVVSGLMI